MYNYNLFRRADRAELVCAVPEVRPVPAFIKGPVWDFVGQIKDCNIGLLSFDSAAADVSVQYNGFYLFQLINVSDLERHIDRDTTQHTQFEIASCDKEWQRETPRSSKPLQAEKQQRHETHFGLVRR